MASRRSIAVASFFSMCTVTALSLLQYHHRSLPMPLDLVTYSLYRPFCTWKSRIAFPSKRGTLWLCMKITPHMNALNHRLV